MNPRDPETQEQFDDSFSTKGLDAAKCMEQVEICLLRLRKEAAAFVADLFQRHGYFNGNMEAEVFHYENVQQVNVQVVVRCYGLPNISPVEATQ